MEELAALNKSEEADNVPLEWLDFEYVKKCKDPNQLRSILGVLKSGKEGKFESLEREVEDSLLKTLSPSEREIWIAQNREPTRADKNFAASLVDGFVKEMNQAGSKNLLKKETETSTTTVFPTISAPIRGSGAVKKAASSSASIQQQQNTAPASTAAPIVAEPIKKRDTKAEPFSSYYKKWEQFDVDKAINEAEETLANDERTKGAAKNKPGSVIIEEIQPEQPNKKASSSTLSTPSTSVASTSSTHPQSQVTNSLAAKREKEKGNECFKAGEFEDASNFYTRALRLEEPDSEAYALLLSNRAQARLKLMQWESAEEDCNLSLSIGKGVVFKTLLRRAQARLKRGRYAEAVSDCRRVITEFSNEKGASLEASKIEAEALVKAKTAGMPLHDAEKTHIPPSVINSAANTKVGKRVMIEEDEEEEEKPIISAELLSSPIVSLGNSARKLIIEEDDEDEEKVEDNAKVPVPIKVTAPPPAPVKAADVQVTKKVSDPPIPPALPVKVESPPPGKEEPLSPKRVERVRRLGLATEEREKGNILFGKGLLEEAKAAYSRAAELDPNDFSSFSNRAQVNLKLNDFDGAISDATVAINLLGVKADTAALTNSNEEAIAVKALFRRASAFKAKKNYELAVKDLTTALSLAPESEKVLAELREMKSLSKNSNGSVSAISSPNPKVTNELSASSPSAKVHFDAKSSPKIVNEDVSLMEVKVSSSPKQVASTESNVEQQGVVSPSTIRATASALAAKATKTLLSSSSLSSSSSNSPMVVPQTANALSQAWKLRKRDPAALLTYLKQLSGTAICDLFKTPAEVDLVSGIVIGLKDAFTTSKPSQEDFEWLVDFLDGLSRSVGFSLISSMLDPKDKKNVQQLMSMAEIGGAERTLISKVLNAFGVA